MKTIHVGADSAGYLYKEELKSYLTSLGYTVIDEGADHGNSGTHYPEYAMKVAAAVQSTNGEAFGILVCGTGIGMSMVANKYDGVRAALCGDTFSARMTREHNNANVLCMGARVIGVGLMKDIVDAFLGASFERGGRHEARVQMIADAEKAGNRN